METTAHSRPEARRPRLSNRREPWLLLLLLVTVAGVSCVNPSFLALGNVSDMLVNAAPVAIVACGATFVIVAGEIDISVGSMMGLLAALLGLLSSTSQAALPVWAAIVLTLVFGTLLGLVNGILVTAGGVPSIIVTLGMLSVLRGCTELVMGGEWITDLPSGLRFIGTGSVLGVPVCLWAAMLVVLAAVAVARFTPVGRAIYAVGSNAEGAWLAGLSLVRTKLFVFALSGFLTGVATVVSVPQLSVVEAGVGRGFELLVVTCVVVGGTSIRGGVGTVAGTLLGVLLLGMIRTVLIFLRLGETATYWERTVQGGFILAAVLADHLTRPRTRGTSR